MNSRLTLNLFLLIGVLALIAVVYFKPGIETPPALPPLTALDSGQIKRIDIVRGKTTVTLERRDGGWWIAGDTPIVADELQIESLLGLASAVPERSYAAGELDLAELQLEPPQTTLRLDGTEFRFGATDPLQGLRYVRLGEQVHLIMDHYQNILQGQRTQLASRKLLPAEADIVALELPGLKLTKNDKTWTVEPAPENLSADAPQKLVDAWKHASALWVRSYQKAVGSKPVAVTLADGQRLVFELRQAEGETLLARPDIGLQYQLPEETAKPLLELESEGADEAAESAGQPEADTPR